MRKTSTPKSPQTLLMLIISIFLVSGCSEGPESKSEIQVLGTDVHELQVDMASQVNRIADQYYAQTLLHNPEAAYFSGVEPDRHDGLSDNSANGRSKAEIREDQMLTELDAIDLNQILGTAEWITHAFLTQELRGRVATRICSTALWNVNQMGGWHSSYGQLAELQPVDTAEFRAQSLVRWGKFPSYVDQEIVNLQSGLAEGFSAPKTVVKRVLDQVDGLLALAVENSPFYSPATRDDDKAFVEATRLLVSGHINPALQRYRDFLADHYMAQAREALSVTNNPNGLDCYEASLMLYTTLNRSGKEVYELGQATVAANRLKVIELGKKAYELDDFSAILDTAKNDPADTFGSKEELLAFSVDMVKRAELEMPNWVGKMPEQPVEVVPFAEHEEGTGRSAHYRPGTDERPGEFRIPLHKPEDQSRGGTETLAFHEAWPGHHLQVAMSKAVEGLHPVTQLIWFSGPGEGWARYSEALAEEMGLYNTITGPITRRAWPARGMVVDPGIHLFAWTREEAKAYMAESGRFPDSQGDAMVDRIAILPGQLTAYDSGGLEILALRRQAQKALGEDFDIKEFHDRVLENGTIPLTQLRTHVEAWISDTR
jgi:uncharacterized protein (DUF885 family)